MRAKLFTALSAALLSTAAMAQVDVRDAWVRGMAPGQQVAAVFMTLHAHTPARLLGVSSPVAGRASVHRTTIENNRMQMRSVDDGLPLPAMADVELKPGGYHVMLEELKRPLQVGETVTLTLRIEQGGKIAEQPVRATVQPLGAQPPGHAGGHH